MADDTEQQMMYARYSQNLNDFNTMRMRLDTQPLLDQLELFLRGARFEIHPDESGEMATKKLQFGTPLANEHGIQEIMSWASIMINNHTVQGNFPVDKNGFSFNYEMAIKSFREQFGNDLVLNIYDWGIKEEQAEGVIDRTCLIVEIFLTRCIGDRERGSYAKTMESKETHLIGGKGIPTFKG